MSKAAAQMSHQGLAELDQPHGDAALVHQLACEHEKRNRHERKTVHAVVDVAVKQRDVFFLAVQPEQQARGRQKAEEDRQSDQQEDEKNRKEPDQHQSAPAMSGSGMTGMRSAPPKLAMMLRRISSMLTSVSRNTPTRMEAIIQLRGTRIHSLKERLPGT